MLSSSTFLVLKEMLEYDAFVARAAAVARTIGEALVKRYRVMCCHNPFFSCGEFWSMTLVFFVIVLIVACLPTMC